jgi:tRNA (uracil-5-)-methyltransferase
MPLPIVDPSRYRDLFDAKAEAVEAALAPLAPPPAQRFASPPLHYRLRAEFRIWHEGDDLDYVMFEPEAPAVPVPQHDFPAGSRRINELMPLLRRYLAGEPLLRRKLFQVEFLTTLSGEALVTLIYHRPLDDAWEAAARQLAQTLSIELIGRSRGVKRVLGRDHVTEQLQVGGRNLHYRQIEGSFTQPNGAINQAMLGWAQAQLPPGEGDLLELYCGNGNFTVALAPHFRRVLATEISKSSVAAAQHNLAVNGCDNVALVRMSSDEISTALGGGREFFRLREVDLDSYRFDTLLVDPPRAGLDGTTLQLASRFERVLYISCNPETLRHNLQALNASHRIDGFALFDQFPYTHHMECGVLLRRR